MRFNALRFRYWLRAINRALPARVCLAEFRNVVDVPGEYRAVDCMEPVMTPFEGLYAPVVHLNLRAFQRVTDADTGLVHFRQLLPHVPAPQPLSGGAPRAADF